ncbi:MAG: aldehyde ferredoxin oxidoreductase C-terminal domain-containing protein [Kiritimatiellae bacterium]|nr:aldehyde ferredoxin oxidoreductase C-terminal domain-containing protein [Kiritimatiellia bacterium]
MESTTYGYNGKLLWVNLTDRTFRYETRPELFFRRFVGGGLLGTRLLMEHTPPGIDPLGPDNLLIFVSSVLAGHPAAGLPRFTVCAKSPLTGGIGETRCEGPWGNALKASGVDAIVVTGASREPVSLAIEPGQVRFLPAAGLAGLTVGETVDRLEAELGKDIHVAAIGPAGERQVRFASIVADRTFQAARMGMGAVMGAKRLKAVVLRGGTAPAPADPTALQALRKSFEARIAVNDLSRWQQQPPGFSCWLYLHGLDAALCVNNYARSSLHGTESFKAEEFMRRYRGECDCPGCPNQCIKVMHPLDRPTLDVRASGIHQEATGTMGPNLGIVSLDWILAANNFCNQHGLDPTSLGFTLSFVMELFERGILNSRDGAPTRFGDAAAAWRLMEDIVARRGLGDVLAEGTRRAAARFGKGAECYAMQVKGLEMVCFEPRSQTNLATGYAVAPIGPRYDICEHDWDFDTKVGWEHTLNLSRALGILERIPMNEISPRKARVFKALHTLWSAADALDLCIFAIAPTRILSLPEMAATLAAVTGWQTGDYEIMRIGERRLHLMRAYNLREGLTAADDTLPERFFVEAIADGPRQGDLLDRVKFHANILDYYRMMGWDDEGRPLRETLCDIGLDWETT